MYVVVVHFFKALYSKVSENCKLDAVVGATLCQGVRFGDTTGLLPSLAWLHELTIEYHWKSLGLEPIESEHRHVCIIRHLWLRRH